MLEPQKPWPPWTEAVGRADALEGAMAPLRSNQKEAVRSIGDALADFDSRRETIKILGWLDTSYTTELLDQLLRIGIGVRDTLRVRNLLGRLPYSEAQAVVPGAVWKLLESEDDADAYRRMAELLDHLGLQDALNQLCLQARDSIDADVREVWEDFSDHD